MVVSHLVLFVSYSPFPEQGVLLGLCLWQLRADAAGRSGGGPRKPLVARQQDDTARKQADQEHGEYLERTG
jgi:hypothetical protein